MDKELEKILLDTVCSKQDCQIGALICKYWTNREIKCRKVIDLISQIKSLCREKAKECVPYKGERASRKSILKNIDQKFK